MTKRVGKEKNRLHYALHIVGKMKMVPSSFSLTFNTILFLHAANVNEHILRLT